MKTAPKYAVRDEHGHKCGCIAQGQRWLELCAIHKAETDAIHERWRAERDAACLAAVEPAL
jgi:hypothetical protein